jgi:hypothetical protein
VSEIFDSLRDPDDRLVNDMDRIIHKASQMYSQSELDAAVAQARLEGHDATCEECQFYIDSKDGPLRAVYAGLDFCERHKELEAAARRKS